MKLLVLKLASLILILAGLIWLGRILEIHQINDFVAQIPGHIETVKTQLPPVLSFADAILDTRSLQIITAIFFLVAGIYGFLPRLPKRGRHQKVLFNGSHGEVAIQLESVQATLNMVLSKMPEVRKINVKVSPSKDKRQAVIVADVVLEHQYGKSSRETAALVTDYIAETATTVLGLEELADIKLNILSTHVNPKKSSAAIRDDLERIAASNALPAPPAAIDARGRSVEAPEDEADSTENVPSYTSRIEPLASSAVNAKPVEEPEEDDDEDEAAVEPVRAAYTSTPAVEEAPALEETVDVDDDDNDADDMPSAGFEDEPALPGSANLADPLEQDSLLGFDVESNTEEFESAPNEADEDSRVSFEGQASLEAPDESEESATGEETSSDSDTSDEPKSKSRWGW